MNIPNGNKPAQDQAAKSGPIPYISTTTRDGIEVPLKQTLIYALLWAGAALVGVLLLAWAFYIVIGFFSWNLPVRLDIIALLALLAFSILFFVRSIQEWPVNRDAWHHIVEHGILNDLNHNGIPDGLEELLKNIAAGTKREATLLVTMDRRGDGSIVDTSEYPHAERMPQLAREHLSNPKKNSLSYGNYGAPGKLFSQGEWKELIGVLLKEKMVEELRPGTENSAVVLTLDGYAMFRSLVAEGGRIEAATGLANPKSFSRFVSPRAASNHSPTADNGVERV